MTADPMVQRYTYDDRTVERFWAKVDKTPTCWLWTAALDRDGYGQFRIKDGQRWVTVGAHRIAYDIEVGLPPKDSGLEPDHTCRVPACVNPAHLDPVTHQTNVRRGISPVGIHSRKTECIHGHPFDEENTHIERWGDRVGRVCKTCQTERNRRRYKR
jgi:hypothetical protein